MEIILVPALLTHLGLTSLLLGRHQALERSTSLQSHEQHKLLDSSWPASRNFHLCYIVDVLKIQSI